MHCQKYNSKIAMDVSVTRALTRFATTSRYPDDAYDFIKEDAELGLKYAKKILDDVKEAIKLSHD